MPRLSAIFLRIIVLPVLGAAAWSWAASPEPDPAARIDFLHDIRPIFEHNCYQCHDAAKHKGGMRLDSKATAFVGGDSGEISIVPHDPDHSKLIQLVRGDDPNAVMPPKGKRIAREQVDLLVRWVKQGANWPDGVDNPSAALTHWSFVKPVRPPIPQVKNSSWVRNPIDSLVLAGLEQNGLSPCGEADRHTLVRRLYLDLIGLAPSPQEVDEFVNDSSPRAYERLVDQLLANPHYGEKWARQWLDLARYADSSGYGSDPLRFTTWRWRDWLIDALNRNERYDQFTIEQIAGDLLPHPTQSQLIATAFNRNSMTNTEGGTDPEEYRVEAVKDRTDTTIQVWMGLTMGCAKCHSHKYDPITNREYYQVFAFFNQSEDANRADEYPTIPTPTAQETAKIASLKSQIERAEKQFNDPAHWADAQAKWERKLNEHPLDWLELKRLRNSAASDAKPMRLPPAGVTEALAIAPEQRTDGQRRTFFDYFLENAPEPRPARQKIAQLKKDLAAVKPTVTAVMRELPPDRRREDHILVKGNFLAKGVTVEPAVPAAFNSFPAGAPHNRLGLARWLVAKDNPLTARVEVNRMWAQLFGTGIVETQEDFGTQGQPPSNQPLLDWLAREFESSGWDMKHLIKLMVMSAAYRQSSKASTESIERDPQNRLISRGPSRRLEAEFVRDEALSLSGLISLKIHGPSVYPPQPNGLWQAAFNGERTYPTSTGEDQYRRGIYVFWRRTVPYPSMSAFDAPSREVCTIRRIQTSTPLQAFVTLNDPVYVECSQALARRIMAEGGQTTDQRAEFALRLCLCRPPEDRQFKRLIALHDRELARYRDDQKAAVDMATSEHGPLPADVAPADAAAWTVCANVLLNMDEVLTKR